MIRNVIFDIGNVLVDFDPVLFFEQRYPKQSMHEVCGFVMDDDWERMDEGVYTCEEVRQLKFAKYPQYQKQIQYIFDDWLDMMAIKQDSVAYMKELKKQGYKIYLLSNIGVESYNYLKGKYDFFDVADGMILSYQVHMIKPDKRIYALLVEKYHLKGEECIFFDDRIQNIESAKAVGIHGIVFTNVAQAKREVMKYVNDK